MDVAGVNLSESHPRWIGRSRMLADELVETLYRCGVTAAFGLDDPRAVWTALRRSPIDTWIVPDERAAGFMADAYVRVTGGMALCSGISGPGAANLVPGLLEARAAATPVLAVVGAKSTTVPGTREFQQYDHAALLAGAVKATVVVTLGDDVSERAAHAARLSLAGRPGPVALVLPEAEMWRPSEDRRTCRTPCVGSGAPGGADERGVEAAAQLLQSAERPVVVAGGGAALSGAGAELLRLAEVLGAVVVATPMGLRSVPEGHPLYAGVLSSYAAGRDGTGRHALPAVEAADVLLVVGSDLDNLAVCDGRWPQPHQSLVRVDVDVDVVTVGCDVGLLGDARHVLTQLIRAVPSGGGRAERSWSRGIAACAHEHACTVRAQDLTRREPDGTVWPGAIMRVLAENLGPGDVVVTDASYSSAWAIDRLPAGASGPRIVTPRSTGTLGWGLPAALGSAGAADGRVVGVVGDGGLAFSVGMLEVAVRAELSVLLLLLNNGVYGSQRNSNVLAQGRDWEDLYLGARTDYAGLAASYGWKSVRADSLAAVRTQIETWTPTDGPVLVDVPVRPDARPPVLKYDVT